MRIELTHAGFADRRLPTWPQRQQRAWKESNPLDNGFGDRPATSASDPWSPRGESNPNLSLTKAASSPDGLQGQKKSRLDGRLFRDAFAPPPVRPL